VKGDLLAGHVHVMFDNLPTSLEYIRAGKLRPLAVSTMTRSDTLPDLPTVAEFVPGYEVSSWFGIGAPRNTPTQVVDKLNAEINAGLAAPKLKRIWAAPHLWARPPPSASSSSKKPRNGAR
jgi:tripartite-type tricarboxylate transporter receptor subunit TctC